MITINIEGPAGSGKSHVIALIGKYLRSRDCNVTIQSEATHNAGTLGLEEEELLKKLRDQQILIQEMRTS
jgi:thymidylate kinase